MVKIMALKPSVASRGQQSGMISVGMGKDDEIDRLRIKGKGMADLLPRLPPALAYPAIDQKACVAGLHQISRNR